MTTLDLLPGDSARPLGPLSTVAKNAVLSECGTFRYFLTRVWNTQLPLMVFLMLNPSTADAEVDDPTIRRCMGFARRDGYGGIIVVNLFSFRSPSPAAMKEIEDPIGPDNELWLQRAFTYALYAKADAVAAWGVDGRHRDRDYEVVKMAESIGLELKCLGKTKGGDPRHPLYVKGDQPLVTLRDEP